MDGILFYWLGWIFWVITTFFMQKGKNRTTLTFFILLIIALSLMKFTILGYEIGLSFFVLICGSFFLLVKQNRKLYTLFVITFIGFSYTGLRLWEVVSPVWVIIPRVYLYAAIIILLTLFFSRNYVQCFLIGCLSISLGEVVYVLLVDRIGWDLPIGDSGIMDLLFLHVSSVLILYIWKEIKLKFEDILQQVELQKKGWTNE
ncbi:hypothetical protein [Paraliobacillus sediminis]|uniref:YphA family membrane protein n=1 Tax=Paraliobacillus sediminis TaxID=1885916 RepID=UPI000E3B6178|nr:hypothetical protein [Paraliobacillus sediminis]